MWRGALNRAYYSCFYAVSAVLLTKDLVSKTHKGTRNLFHLHFIENRIISRDFGKSYSELFGYRQQNDYEDFEELPPELISEMIEFADNFIEKLMKVSKIKL